MSEAYLPKTTSSPVPRFRRGDLVEVSLDQYEGLRGSYFEATVLQKVPGGKYLVEFETLKRNDFTGPLVEEHPAAMIRPRPDKVVKAGFRLGEFVDVFDNDGWWFGQVTDKEGSNKYCVYFEKSSGDEIWYPKKQLRVHQELVFVANKGWACVHNL